MSLITGYKLETLDAVAIEKQLVNMQCVIEKEALKQYHRLLSREVELLVDHIALNIEQRPETRSLLDVAQERLNQKVAYASGRILPMEYNLNVTAHLMYLDDCAYIRLNTEQDYEAALGKIERLLPYSLEKSDMEKERGEVWGKLMEKYKEKIQPCVVQLFPRGPIQADPKQMEFQSRSQRSKTVARHNLTNRYLGMYACGEQIPNFKLMEYMDNALDAVMSFSNSKTELKQMETQLRTILPNITIDMIEKIPEINAEE